MADFGNRGNQIEHGGAFLYTLRPDRRPMANEPH